MTGLDSLGMGYHLFARKTMNEGLWNSHMELKTAQAMTLDIRKNQEWGSKIQSHPMRRRKPQSRIDKRTSLICFVKGVSPSVLSPVGTGVYKKRGFPMYAWQECKMAQTFC